MSIAVDVLGTAVQLWAPTAVLEELRAVLVDLPPGQDPQRHVVVAGIDGGLALFDDERVVRRDIAPVVAAATVVWHLNTIATEATGHVLLHAGCVADEHGGAVLLPGRSGAGKSTLTVACVAAGLSYLSDELAALDVRRGTITPYAKPLGLEGERLVAATALGGPIGGATAPAAIVFPRFEPGAELSEVPLDVGWTLLALAAHAPNLAALGGRGLAWLAGLALACPASQITHGDAHLAVPAVRRAARRAAVPVAPAPTLPPVTATTTTVALGDDLAVLHHPTGKVHLLNSTAAVVWRCAVGALDAASAVESVLRSADAPRLGRAALAATIDHLVRAGLLPTGDAPVTRPQRPDAHR